MPTASATVATEKARRYLAQLCKHFAHKIPVELNETSGLARFEPGACRILASVDNLLLVCESESEDGLVQVMSIVEDHVVRFGWKGNLRVAWHVEGSPISGEEQRG